MCSSDLTCSRVWSTCSASAQVLQTRAFDLVLFDVRLPDGDGLALLDRLRKGGLRCPAVVMTAFGTLDRAVQALKAGATDFLVKPFDNARLLSAVGAALESAQRADEVGLRGARVSAETEVARNLVGASGGLKPIADLLPRVAQSDATVLIQGESGTGKELVARALHASSTRMDGPFVAVNCAALPPSLLESELFGFERGAFTGAHATRKGLVEVADGGTLFLDELGDMALEAQARLLRVLQEREITRIGGRTPIKVDLRVIAATHRDLAAMVKSGAFRADLHYRLSVVPIRLPPLRERPGDIPALVEHFLQKHAARHRVAPPSPDAATLARAQAHAWPGNVRELENVVERAVVLGRFELPQTEPAPQPATSTPAPTPASTPAPIVDRLNRAIVAALNAPEVKDTLFKLGQEVVGGGPAALAAAMKEDRERMGKVIKAAGIRAE